MTGRAHGTHVANILATYGRAPDGVRLAGWEWYPRAHTFCDRVASATGLSLPRVAGVVSALSPSNTWDRNLTDADAFCRAYVDRAPLPSVSTYPVQVGKALAILGGAPITDALRGRKTVAFYRNIVHPNRPEAFWTSLLDHVPMTIDGHAANIARNDRRPLSGVRITVRQYRNLARSYVLAARRANVPPAVMQATTWTQWRVEA